MSQAWKSTARNRLTTKKPPMMVPCPGVMSWRRYQSHALGPANPPVNPIAKQPERAILCRPIQASTRRWAGSVVGFVDAVVPSGVVGTGSGLLTVRP